MITFKKIMILLALLATLAAMLSGTASAPETLSFICDGKAFVVQNTTGDLKNVTLDGTASLTQIFTAGTEYNNMGYRSTDGLLYAVNLTGDGYTGGNTGIIQIDANGNIVNLGIPAGLPNVTQARFDAGDISSDGNTMYITFGARTNDPQTTLGYHLKLYKVDLGNWTGVPNPLPPVTFVNITGDDSWVNDWAYNPNDGNLYGGDQWGTGATTPGQLSVLNTTTGVRTDYNVESEDGTNPNALPTTPMGAAWFDTLRGTVFIYRNNPGTIYEINLTASATGGPKIVDSWSAPTSTRNDGAFCPAVPGIEIQKSTNGQDADDPTGPVVPVGSTVTWSYNVTNSGNVPLANVTITDNRTGFTYDCGTLQPGEWCNVTNTSTAIEDQYANLGNVTADYNGTEVNDTDPSHYFGANASIDIEKSTNGEDADSPTGPVVPVGSTVTWSYNVTNSGNVPLDNVTITDNRTGFTHDCGTLQPGEWCNVTNTSIAIEGQYANLGNVTADFNGSEVNDTDPSHYFGEEEGPEIPSIDIEKFTEGVDADEPTGPELTIGDSVEWTYVVTNNGTVTLTNVSVVDDKGVVVTCPKDTLAPGENMTCTANGTVEEGQYMNNATVTAKFGDIEVNDTDPSHYFGTAGGEEPVPATNVLITAGMLGLVVALFMRRER